MGNQQCIGCNTKVPKQVKWLDVRTSDWGRRFYKFWTGIKWIKTSKGYICHDCFKKRQAAEKEREQAPQREVQGKRQQEEIAKRETEARQKQELERESKAERKQEMEEEKICQEERTSAELSTPEREQAIEEKSCRERLTINVHKSNAEHHTCLSKSTSSVRASFFNYHAVLDKTNVLLNYEESVRDYLSLQQLPIEYENTENLPTAGVDPSDSQKFITERTKSDLKRKSGKVTKCKENADILEEVRYQEALGDDLLTTAKILLSEYRNFHEKKYMYEVFSTEPVFVLHRKGNLDIQFMSDNELALCICEICFAVKKSKKFWPRNTQVLSLLILIKSFFQGKLLEIKTGEGKTCTIAMFSAFLGLLGFSVDIVSSSPILAKRDSQEWKDFYNLLSINVDCNLLPNDNDERIKCYGQQIVYGTVGSFASDILREKFLMERVRGDRKLQVVIVDEVDCMLLDQGVNSTYLSNSIPSLHYLEPVILMIWAQVIRHPVIHSDKGDEYFCGILQPFYLPFCRLSSEEFLSDPFHILEILESNDLLNPGFTECLQQEGLRSMEAFKLGNGNVQNTTSESVLDYVNEDNIMACLEFMENIFNIQFEPYKMIDENTISQCKYVSKNKGSEILYLLLTNQGYVCPLYESRNKVIETIKTNVEDKLSSSENEYSYEIPNHLFLFVRNRLTTWIESAFIAKFMSEGREYLVRETEIVPVDYESTGVVELNTKWGDCLHQFLEIKHEKRISQLTIETNFMSNQTFFTKYRRVFGVTGTLGTDLEIKFLERTYGLTCVKIPTHCQSRFTENEPMLCFTKEDWQSQIAKCVSKIVEMKRAALVICEDINTSKLLQVHIKEKVREASVSLYTRNDMDEKIPEKLRTADVIISTNIAGRGTDIEVDSNVKSAGGLFVLVTFFPSNERVENQIFGRCARKGLPGSAQLVINLENLPGYSCMPKMSVQLLRDYRAISEQRRLQDIEHRDLNECLQKEKLFECYCNILSKSLFAFNHDKNLQIIRRNYLHEWWGIWLKKNFKRCDSCELKEMLIQDFSKVCQKLLRCNKSPTENVAHFVKLANEHFSEGRYMTAKKLYSEAISMDKKCSSFAYYQRAYCTLKESKGSNYIDEAMNDLWLAQKYLVRDKQTVMLSIILFDLCRDKRNDEGHCETLQQFGVRCQLLNYVDENISMTLETLKEMKSKSKKAEAKGDNILTVALGEMKICKMVDTEAYIFWELGLTEIMTISEKAPFCWKGSVVSLIGVTEIAVGGFLLATTAGILANVGSSLIVEGINDICTGSHAMITKNNNFVKSWMIGKTVSIATSMATFGFSQVKTATSGVSGCKNTFIAVKNQLKNGANGILQNVKSIPKAVTSKTFGITLKGTCKSVAKDVSMNLTKRGAKFLVNESKSKLREHFDEIARKKIEREVRIVIFEGNLKEILNDFIFYYYREGMDSSTKSESCVEKKFENMIQSLRLSKDMPQVRQLLLGCLSGLGKYAEENIPTLNEFSTTDSLVDVLKSLSTCTYEVGTLVQHYSEKLEGKINDDFQNGLIKYHVAISEESEQIKTTSLEYINKKKTTLVDIATTHILKLLQETFDFTCSLKFAGNLQSVVGGVVSHYVSEHAVGKNIIQTILSLSSKTLKDTELVSQIENITEQICPKNAAKYLKLGLQTMKTAIAIGDSTKIDHVFEHGLRLAENAANTFADEKTKLRITSLLKISKSCLNIYQQNGNASTLLTEGMDIMQNGLENFCPEHAAKILTFGVKTMKVALSVSGEENVEETFVHGLQLAEDAVNTLADEKTKTLTNFLLKIAKTRIHTSHFGRKTSELLKVSLDILQDGFEVFDTENSGKVIRFGIQTLKVALSVEKNQNIKETVEHGLQLVEDGKFLTFGVKTRKVALAESNSLNVGEVLDHGIQLTEDAINTFTNGTTKKLSTCLFNIAKVGIHTFQSNGKPSELLKESLDILHSGVEYVCPEDSKRFLTLGVKTMNMALSVGKGQNAEETLSCGLQLASDAVNTFTDGKTKQILIHLVNIAKLGVRTLQTNGNPSELLKESLDILHSGIECVCPENSKRFLTFGVKTMNVALSVGKGQNAEETLSCGLQLASDAVNTFTDGKTKQISTHLVNIAKLGVRALQSNGKPSELLKESLDILHSGVECVCPEDSKKILTFGVKTMYMALSVGNGLIAEEALSHGLHLAEDAVITFTDDKTKQFTSSLVNIAKIRVRNLQSDGKPSELLKECLDMIQNV